MNENNADLYDLNGYVTIKGYRKQRRGGGVSLYIRDEISFAIRNDLGFFDSEMESIFIEIDKDIFRTNCNIVIGLIYRTPDSSVDVFNERISDILNTVCKEHKIFYCIGDLNIDFFKYDVHKPTSAMLDTIYACNVFPLITKPTRVTETTATLIDHILTNNIDIASNHLQGILCTDISDHYAIFHIAGNIKYDETNSPDVRLIRDIRQCNINKFINEMQLVEWDSVTNKTDTQAAYSEFHRILCEKYNKCFPYRKLSQPYYNNKPWLTNALKESIKTKNKLFVNRNKGSNTEERNACYKAYRNRLHHLLRMAERQYYQDLILQHKANIKKSWQVIKSIINKRKYCPVNSKFKYNGDVISDGKTIANRFNNFFVNVGESLANEIPSTDRCPSEYIKYEISEKFYASAVTEDEICKIICNFKDSAAGWDDLRPHIMKLIQNCIKSPLAHICNRSFMTGIFPSELKIANVVPIFKSGDDMVFSNYRPVSVLPVLSKILERLMYNRLILYINCHGLLYEYQFGFQKGKSTHMALITLIDKITEALDQGELVIGIFLDFSKAFDSVDHDILLQKLELYGVQDIALKWFDSYLSNRLQYVTYNNVKSDKENVKCGVPQGSIVGPLLFLLYINDLTTVATTSLSVLFADDTNIFLSGKNLDSMSMTLNEQLTAIYEWLCCNKLSLNVLKTHYMIFTPRNKKVNDINLYINKVPIGRVYVTKFLGVQIDSQLNWKNHIEYTCKKLSKCIGILSKAWRKLQKSSLISLYYSFAFPYFIYCNHVWGSTYQTNLNNVVLVQKKLIRIITCSPFRAHTEPLMLANRLMTCIFVYQCLNGCVPDIFNDFYTCNRNIHGRETRQASDLHVPYGRLDIRQNSMKIHGANMWNSIPEHVKMPESVYLFKQRLRNFLLDRKNFN